MSIDAIEAPAIGADADAGPLGPLPRLTRQQVRADRALRRGIGPGLGEALGWLGDALGTATEAGTPEVFYRASGLGRPGVIVHLSWPRLGTRLALGIETPLAHAIVDRLLGFDRLAGEERRQVTPVEWGILTFVAARTLDRLAEQPGPLGPWDLLLDRVGPEPFPAEGLGPIATVRWPVRIGPIVGSVRLWLPESLLAAWIETSPPAPPSIDPDALRGRFAGLGGIWRAEAGTVRMPRGLGRLRVGGVLPIDGSPLRGTAASPEGPVELALLDRDGRSWFPATPAPMSAGGRLILSDTLRREPNPREAPALSTPTDPASPPEVAPADMPVTLTVELGKVNIPLARLADLKPGDVIELGRHSREPVELASNGRLVARGELVQIDTELGVRVLNVFL